MKLVNVSNSMKSLLPKLVIQGDPQKYQATKFTPQSNHAGAVKPTRFQILGAAKPWRPRINQEQLEALLKKAIDNPVPKNSKINLAQLLTREGYPTDLHKIIFSDKNKNLSLQEMCLEGLTFTHCAFDWSHFSEATLSNCVFRGVQFTNTSFENANIQNCQFNSCTFSQPMFVHAKLNRVRFHCCRIADGSFENAAIQNVEFMRVNAPGTHFLDAKVSQSRIHKSNLTNTLFLGHQGDFDVDSISSATAKVTKPVAATLVSTQVRGVSGPLVQEKIEAQGMLMVRIAMHPPIVGKREICEEVDRILTQIKQETDAADKRSIPQKLLANIASKPEESPNAARLIDKTKTIARYVDSIVLPGGEDISPNLYGQEKDEKTEWDGDYRRSLLEFGLIQASIAKGIPLTAICRAFQAISLFSGVQALYQDVGRQVGVHRLARPVEPQVGQEHGILGKRFHSIDVGVFHHQAVPSGSRINNFSEVLSRTIADPKNTNTKLNIVMAMETQYGVPMLAFQFHPEFYSPSNVPRRKTNTLPGNNTLMERAKKLVSPGSNQTSFKTPGDLFKSGIFEQTSLHNNHVWKIIHDAGNAYRYRKSITADQLKKQRELLSGTEKKISLGKNA